jgi:hypothetical protein
MQHRQLHSPQLPSSATVQVPDPSHDADSSVCGPTQQALAHPLTVVHQTRASPHRLHRLGGPSCRFVGLVCRFVGPVCRPIGPVHTTLQPLCPPRSAGGCQYVTKIRLPQLLTRPQPTQRPPGQRTPSSRSCRWNCGHRQYEEMESRVQTLTSPSLQQQWHAERELCVWPHSTARASS